MESWKQINIPDYIKEYRENLLNNPTTVEKHLKSLFSRKGIKYEFQKLFKIGERFYIADFYFPKKKIILEVDGLYHFTNEQQIKDLKRTKDLETKNLKIVRITNDEVFSKDFEKLKPIVVINSENKKAKKNKQSNNNNKKKKKIIKKG